MSKLDPLRQAVAVSPDNIPLLLLLAQACLDEWSLDEARSIYERVLRLDPARPEGKVGVARILHLSGKTSEAVVRIEALLGQHPELDEQKRRNGRVGPSGWYLRCCLSIWGNGAPPRTLARAA